MEIEYRDSCLFGEDSSEEVFVKTLLEWASLKLQRIDLQEMLMKACNPTVFYKHPLLNLTFQFAKEDIIDVVREVQQQGEIKKQTFKDMPPRSIPLFNSLLLKLRQYARLYDYEIIEQRVVFIFNEWLNNNATICGLIDAILEDFFPSSKADKPRDRWTYYEMTHHFLTDFRNTFFPWLDTPCDVFIDPIPHFDVDTRMCSFRITSILEKAAACKSDFKYIVQELNELFLEDPITFSGANTYACHEAVYVHVRNHPEQFAHLIFMDSFDTMFPQQKTTCHMPSAEGSKIVHHAIELTKLGDLSNDLFAQIMFVLHKHPQCPGIYDTASREAITESIHQHRLKHGSDHQYIDSYIMFSDSEDETSEEELDRHYFRRHRINKTNIKKQRKD
jgi:hypothetical protein